MVPLKEGQRRLEPPSVIINSALNTAPQALKEASPSLISLKKVVQRKRNEIFNVPANPTQINDLTIPETFQNYKTAEIEEYFLLFDSGLDDPNRILIFGRSSWLNYLNSEAWFCDGTFKISPPLFEQVYAILSKVYE